MLIFRVTGIKSRKDKIAVLISTTGLLLLLISFLLVIALPNNKLSFVLFLAGYELIFLVSGTYALITNRYFNEKALAVNKGGRFVGIIYVLVGLILPVIAIYKLFF